MVNDEITALKCFPTSFHHVVWFSFGHEGGGGHVAFWFHQLSPCLSNVGKHMQRVSLAPLEKFFCNTWFEAWL